MERKTEQRGAIRTVFETASRPLDVQEILAEAQRHVPKLGQATVYRHLKKLCEENWLKTVTLPGEPVRYERAALAHHHHFSCRKCSRVFDIHACLEGFHRLLPAGFTMESHEIILYGVCEQCNT